MDLNERVSNAELDSYELSKLFTTVSHRAHEFEILQNELAGFRKTIADLTVELQELKKQLDVVHSVLPGVARKEEIIRITEKIDAQPFELFATRKDIQLRQK